MILDRYGITQFYESKGREWFNTWDNGNARTIISKGTSVRNQDPYDVEFDLHCGKGERGHKNQVIIDGNGIATFDGTTPRGYINKDGLFWQNVEMTAYHRYLKSYPKGGATVIHRQCVRSDHHLEYKCAASGTGYSHEEKANKVIQAKREAGHPCYADNIISKTKGGQKNMWIGMKTIIYNIGQTVRFQGLRDLTEGVNGGDWKVMFDVIHDGNNWKMTDSVDLKAWKKLKSGSGECQKLSSPNEVQLKPRKSCYFRNDNTVVEVKWASIREI